MKKTPITFRMFAVILALISFQGKLEPALANHASIPLPGDDFPRPGAADFTPLPAFKQTSATFPFELRGYVENTTTLAYLNETAEDRLLNAIRARVDLAGEPNEALDFGIGVVGTMHQGATTVNIGDYLPDRVRESLIPDAEQLLTYQMDSEDLFVQEAFGTLYTDHFRLRVGRHKFYTGTGYAYNPIDLLNVKNPLDPTYETDGLDALLLTVELPHQTQLQGLVRYQDRLKNSDYLARLTTYRNGWDLALQYTHHLKKRTDWDMLNTEEALEALRQGASFDDFSRRFHWHLVAAEFAGDVAGFGVYGEGGYVVVDAPDDVGTLIAAARHHERLLIGLDRTFACQLYLLVEYLRVGQGATGNDERSLNDYAALFSGEHIASDRDTLFTGLSYPLTDVIEGSLYARVSLNDGSGLINPWLLHDLRPGLKLSVSLTIPFGGQDGANGNVGISGFARLKWHF